MRKFSILLSMLVLAAMVLAACGGGATSTNVVESPPPVTADATEDVSGTATESPTEPGTTTETPGVPVTGDVNPSRLSNQLDFTVWSQDGDQIGEVEDMVLDMDNTPVTYVVVGTGGFLDLGEREILVPWDSLELQTGTGDTTGGQQNAFILQTDLDPFSNAPDFDLGTLPEMGQSAGDWDVDLRSYWEGGGAGAGGTANTPAAAGTPAADATATVTGAGAGTDQGTATPDASAGASQGTATADPGQVTGTGQGQALQGVVLATEVLGSTINWGAQGQGTGTGVGTEQATATPEAGAGTGQATATAAPGATTEATATAGTGGTGAGTDQGNTTGTIEDMIVDTDTGEILYIVIMAGFAEGERWIPVPLGLFQWNGAAGAFNLNADATMLQTAPSFENSEFPDTTMDGWNSEIDTFWQNNAGTGASGSSEGTGAQATATP